MEAISLPVLVCTAKCPRCNLPMQFNLFESGMGGDFETFVGVKTGSLYRLDLGKVHYLKKKREELLHPAVQVEGGAHMLRQLPYCTFCKTEFPAEHSHVESESTARAFQL